MAGCWVIALRFINANRQHGRGPNLMGGSERQYVWNVVGFVAAIICMESVQANRTHWGAW
jgi:hypothetical protein